MNGRPFKTPALDAWRAELKQGLRATHTFDALWRSACAEQSALNAAADGLYASARQDLRRAREILDEALRTAEPTS
jgi:hypothetical protein